MFRPSIFCAVGLPMFSSYAFFLCIHLCIIYRRKCKDLTFWKWTETDCLVLVGSSCWWWFFSMVLLGSSCWWWFFSMVLLGSSCKWWRCSKVLRGRRAGRLALLFYFIVHFYLPCSFTFLRDSSKGSRGCLLFLSFQESQGCDWFDSLCLSTVLSST